MCWHAHKTGYLCLQKYEIKNLSFTLSLIHYSVPLYIKTPQNPIYQQFLYQYIFKIQLLSSPLTLVQVTNM